jgi:peptidoglycan/xylan/chitin deacetylase (PgdA/CDA1 family)
MLIPQNVNKNLTTPRVIITFDDGSETTYTKAFPIMQTNGQKGVSYIISNIVGDAGRMTLAQLTEMYNAGWDIGNHSENHVYLTSQIKSVLHSEIDNCSRFLFESGFIKSYKMFSYPYGDYNQTVVDYLISQNFQLCRSSIEGQYDEQLELGGNNQFLMKSRYIAKTTATATVQGYIDDVITNGGLCVLMFHAIVDADAGDYEYLTADFQTISDYIKTKVDAKLLKCVTMSEYYRDYLNGENTAGQKEIRGLSHG